MMRSILAFLAFAAFANAQAFSFRIGAPVASQDFQFKSAAFVFRTEGCAGVEKLKITAAAVGRVNGERRSMDLHVAASSSHPGVFAVAQQWPQEGNWVVSLKGECGDKIAGAIVPLNRQGFIRESAKFFSRAAKDSEIDAALKDLAKKEEPK